MTQHFVFNEASIPFVDADKFNSNLMTFFMIAHKSNSEGVLCYHSQKIEKINLLNFFDGFNIENWVNCIENNDHSLLVKLVLSKFKFLPIPNEHADTKSIFSHSTDYSIEVHGLGIASKIGTYGLSCASNLLWESDSVSILREWDEEGVTKKLILDVDNIYSLTTVDEAIADIKNIRQSNIVYLRDLKIEENVDFLNIVFCESALKDFRSTSVTSDDFIRIIEVLNRLNMAITKSVNLDQLINNSGLDISLESTETMNCGKHARKRKFKHPTLGIKVFEAHIKNFSGGKRMHILADYAGKKISIGYFGLHLSTVNFPK